MARYLTAVEAARRLGKTERTVRRWIDEGKLHARHIAKNRLGISEDDIDALAQELAQYEESAPAENGQALAARIEQLESRVSQLETALAALLSPVAQEPLTYSPAYHDRLIREPQAPGAPVRKGRPAIASAASVTPGDLPPGSLSHKDFAERHGMSARTFRDQIDSGKVDAITRPKPNRPGEYERWLTPDQQRQALAFWRARNANITQPCAYPDCVVCSEPPVERAANARHATESGESDV